MSDDAYRLIHACYDGLDAAAVLLDAEPGLLLARTGLGETALHYLAFENQGEAVRWLFERGASLDTVSDLLMSPLADAAHLGHEALVDWLLDSGATLDLPGQCVPTLIAAVGSGSAPIVARVLAAGADVAVTDRRGRSAMQIARYDASFAAVVDVLQAHGAAVARAS